VYWLKHYDPTTGIVELGNPWGTNPLITPKPMTIAQLSEAHDHRAVERTDGCRRCRDGEDTMMDLEGRSMDIPAYECVIAGGGAGQFGPHVTGGVFRSRMQPSPTGPVPAVRLLIADPHATPSTQWLVAGDEVRAADHHWQITQITLPPGGYPVVRLTLLPRLPEWVRTTRRSVP